MGVVRRFGRKQKKAKAEARVSLEEATRRAVLQFQEDNGSHDWAASDVDDSVRCLVCGRCVTADQMMSERVQLAGCLRLA